MKEIIAVINQKGGVGKSTTALAMGAGLFQRGYKTLTIDLDAQGNTSFTLRVDPRQPTILELLTKEARIQDAIQHTAQGDAIAFSPALAGADGIIIEIGKEYRLAEALQPVMDSYDYAIIDTPPALGVLTVNALTACSSVLIPAQTDVYSIQGIQQLHNTIQTVKRYCNPSLAIKGILLTRYNPRAILNRELGEIIEWTAKQLETIVFQTAIRENIAIREAQASQQDIYTYAPKSNAALDYAALVDEFLLPR